MSAYGFSDEVTGMTLKALIEKYPLVSDYLANHRLNEIDLSKAFSDALLDVDPDMLEEFGLDSESIVLNLCTFLDSFSPDSKSGAFVISSITIIGGQNKSGEAENLSLTIKPGEIISIVGPTGSGKSRLLEDIECMAQEDTPTKRKILINGNVPDESQRFDTGVKLVAQLSQTMNFVMDLTVREFLEMHAKSRLVTDVDGVVKKCFECANSLAGEKFTPDTKVTQLSGGQSRALMIADTALMSASPVILIDEIENAGIDRREAIKLLSGNEKVILMSTHDPLLALFADKRIVIRNGGIAKVIVTTDDERKNLIQIEKLDNILLSLRNSLRHGDIISSGMIDSMINR
ncbi:ABC-type lipoprotein export system ATPase subunit [Methanomicrobium sp. W14]|uniref:ATP-binding cassette domain-containing protein n=1 Tax=Methanomicrobium sp. W14 TaxID=2817839 RepID=UPI001AEAD4DA|nr:ABC transporter ATP-binding protein [Methanomicrobium sp. W14]MBP2134040.1 ABC-type lipoprotein export system ATPase subunit [Methanomicrobium sp. W14]